MTSEQPLLIDHRGAVDWLTLNRPASGNALDPALVDALVDYFEGLRDRPAQGGRAVGDGRPRPFESCLSSLRGV